MSVQSMASPVGGFLKAATPRAWLERAVVEIDLLLLDHANCEMKAAATALSLMHRYPGNRALVNRMSRLAREELRHFEQVQRHIDRCGIVRRRVTPSRYAAGLLRRMPAGEPRKLELRLLVGALIEARSCERFAALAERVPAELGELYRGLLESERRHFEDYLDLARTLDGASGAPFDNRLRELLELEAELITSPDPEFRFHSGEPIASNDCYEVVSR